MGIGYDNNIVLYIPINTAVDEPMRWYSYVLSNCRVELVEGKIQQITGSEEANKIIVKIYDKDITIPYITPEKWEKIGNKQNNITFNKNSYILLKNVLSLSIDINPPIGLINEKDYDKGLIDYLTEEYGGIYKVNTIEHYNLIPHWHIGGN